MMVKSITEVTIYESPDGGKTVYSRKNGSPMRQLHSISSDLETEMSRVEREAQWMAILKLSERSPALQEAVDRAIILYELQKGEGDEPLMWHPV
jgi:hypothetical protein